MTQHIVIKELFKSFGSKKVLEGINLNIERSESMVIIGGSGSGKSVFIKTIAGLIEPDSGSIKIEDIEVNKISKANYKKLTTKFGFLFQGSALFDSLSVWENVSFSFIQNNLANQKHAKEIALDKLAKVGLKKDVAELYPSELSGGMQKRVALARAIATNPEIIFFDEPTTGLDPIMSNIINDLIVKCSSELKATTITITHDMSSVKNIASRVAMLQDGKIIWCDKIDNLFNNDNIYVNRFVNGDITEART